MATNVTYEQLKKILDKMSTDDLKKNITVHVNNEFFPVYGVGVEDESDVIMDGLVLYIS